MILTEGTVADSTQADPLTEGSSAEYLLADKGYNTNAIVSGATARGMEPVIPPRRHRKEPGITTRACIGCGIWLRKHS